MWSQQYVSLCVFEQLIREITSSVEIIFVKKRSCEFCEVIAIYVLFSKYYWKSYSKQ